MIGQWDNGIMVPPSDDPIIIKMEFYFQSNSVRNSLKFSKAKSPSHCLTELLPIYQNNILTNSWWDDHTTVSSYHHIILKIVRFLVCFLKSNLIFCKFMLKNNFVCISGQPEKVKKIAPKTHCYFRIF